MFDQGCDQPGNPVHQDKVEVRVSGRCRRGFGRCPERQQPSHRRLVERALVADRTLEQVAARRRSEVESFLLQDVDRLVRQAHPAVHAGPLLDGLGQAPEGDRCGDVLGRVEQHLLAFPARVHSDDDRLGVVHVALVNVIGGPQAGITCQFQQGRDIGRGNPPCARALDVHVPHSLVSDPAIAAHRDRVLPALPETTGSGQRHGGVFGAHRRNLHRAARQDLGIDRLVHAYGNGLAIANEGSIAPGLHRRQQFPPER